MQILEPLKEYYTRYKVEFAEKNSKMFEDLVSKSGVDEAGNAKTVAEYNATMDNKQSYERKLNSVRIQKTVAIVVTVLSLIAALVGILDIAGAIPLELGTTVNIIFIVVGIILAVAMILVICLVHNKKIHELRLIVSDLARKAQSIQDVAYSQAAPLNALYSDDILAQLIHSVIPEISINRYMSGRFDKYLSNRFGFATFTDENRSIFDVISGTYGKSPFLIERNLTHEMGTKEYTGTLLITWTEYYTDSDGNRHSRTKSQTLYASVIKPFPVYYDMTSTMYLSDACPSLIFSRDPKLEGDESERELDRIIRRGEKKIDRLSKKALKEDDDFVGLNNTEFDVLFDALDRNDDMQFNLLFTPAAQDNLTDLIKSKKPYGDDFHYRKNGKYNVIMSEHMQHFDINFNEHRYQSYDINASREIFNTYNTDFFERFYFELAPIFSVPLFYEHGYTELPDSAGSTTSTREATSLANYMINSFTPSDANTSTILKLDFVCKEGVLDKYLVRSYAYRGEPRLDYVSKLGGDGHMHAVPVEWVEYVPTYSERYMWAADVWNNSYESDQYLRDHNIVEELNVDPACAIINNGLIAFTMPGNEVSPYQIESFGRIAHS